MTEQEQPKNDFMHKLALQNVERRNLVFLIAILGTIFTIFSRSWVKVESDLTTYLPKTSETRMGLDIMEKEFTTYGSADVMVANITPDEAGHLNDELAGLRGIQMIEHDDTTARHELFHALRFSAGVVRTVALQQIDHTPHAKASAEGNHKCL